MNKKLLVGSLSLAIVGISCLAIVSKPTYKTIDNSNLEERMAVYIKNETGNYEKSNNIPTSGYVLNEEKSTCNNNAIPTWNRTDNSLNIKDLSINTSCYLYFDEKEIVPTSEIINSIKIIAKTNAPNFSQIADTDEGIYAVEDGMYSGTSYYYRGAVTNNYVKFGGFCWRIIRFNGDGSIRMIYDGESCHANGTSTEESIAPLDESQAYNTKYYRSYSVGYTYTDDLQRPTNNPTATASNLKTQTDSWYSEQLVAYDRYIAEGKFCNDRNTASGSTWVASGNSFYYAARGRLESAKTPTLDCNSGDVYTLKAGAITADEVSFAGGVLETVNKNYYLYNGQYYWTMTPHYWYGGSAGYVLVFCVNNDGEIRGKYVHRIYGVRPVINLRADTIFQSGTDGTIDNPYVVEGA